MPRKKKKFVLQGDRLKEHREDLGLTQDELGKAAEVSKNTISAYETGGAEPSLDTLVKLAKILDISADYLLGIVDEEIPSSRKYYLALSRDYPPELKDDLLKQLELLKLKYKQE